MLEIHRIVVIEKLQKKKKNVYSVNGVNFCHLHCTIVSILWQFIVGFFVFNKRMDGGHTKSMWSYKNVSKSRIDFGDCDSCLVNNAEDYHQKVYMILLQS